jgi:hypothetical protein
MIPLYVLKIKIYHFSTKFLQFGQISDLKSIDSKLDMQDPLVSAEVAQIEVILLRWTWPHMSDQ